MLRNLYDKHVKFEGSSDLTSLESWSRGCSNCRDAGENGRNELEHVVCGRVLCAVEIGVQASEVFIVKHDGVYGETILQGDVKSMQKTVSTD